MRPRIQILSFSCSFRQKIWKIIGLWQLADPTQENPGSATESEGKFDWSCARRCNHPLNPLIKSYSTLNWKIYSLTSILVVRCDSELPFFCCYSCNRSGTVNSNTVNSKFHLIRSYCEIFFYHFANISCLKCTVNSNFHLIRSKTLPTNDFELTVPDLYRFYSESHLQQVRFLRPPTHLRQLSIHHRNWLFLWMMNRKLPYKSLKELNTSGYWNFTKIMHSQLPPSMALFLRNFSSSVFNCYVQMFQSLKSSAAMRTTCNEHIFTVCNVVAER